MSNRNKKSVQTEMKLQKAKGNKLRSKQNGGLRKLVEEFTSLLLHHGRDHVEIKILRRAEHFTFAFKFRNANATTAPAWLKKGEPFGGHSLSAAQRIVISDTVSKTDKGRRSERSTPAIRRGVESNGNNLFTSINETEIVVSKIESLRLSKPRSFPSLYKPKHSRTTIKWHGKEKLTLVSHSFRKDTKLPSECHSNFQRKKGILGKLQLLSKNYKQVNYIAGVLRCSKYRQLLSKEILPSWLQIEKYLPEVWNSTFKNDCKQIEIAEQKFDPDDNYDGKTLRKNEKDLTREESGDENYTSDSEVTTTERTHCPGTSSTSVENNLLTKKRKVYIAHGEEDFQLAEHLRQLLQARGLSCTSEQDFIPGTIIMEGIQNAIGEANYVVLLLSTEFLNTSSFYLNLLPSLGNMYEKNVASVIPVLVDITETGIPPSLKHFTFVSMREDPYPGKLISLLEGPEVKIHELMPAGNVSHGLVWSYYLNYLRFILPDIGKRINQWSKTRECLDPLMSRKFYILIPASCFCPSSLENLPGGNMSFGGHLQDVVRNQAGCKRRVYRHTVWNVTKSNGQVLHFVGEYAMAIHTMYRMESVRNAGLNSKEREKQTRQFFEMLRTILDNNQHIEARVIRFIDTDECGRLMPIGDILIPYIEEDMSVSETSTLADCTEVVKQ